jgi:hypothetical protein
MFLPSSPAGRRALAGLCLPAAALVFGCSQSKVGKVVPVEGRVTVDHEPLLQGMVSYLPNAAKGNPSPFAAVGKVENGTYTLSTEGRPGAPVGWYKVVVSHAIPGEGGGMRPREEFDPNNRPGASPSFAPPPFNARYTIAEQTTLEIEVVESPQPSAYNLELTAR